MEWNDGAEKECCLHFHKLLLLVCECEVLCTPKKNSTKIHNDVLLEMLLSKHIVTNYYKLSFEPRTVLYVRSG